MAKERTTGENTLKDEHYLRDIDFLTEELEIIPENEFASWDELTLAQRAGVLWIMYGTKKAKKEDDYIRPVEFLKAEFQIIATQLRQFLGERSLQEQFNLLMVMYETEIYVKRNRNNKKKTQH